MKFVRTFWPGRLRRWIGKWKVLTCRIFGHQWIIMGHDEKMDKIFYVCRRCGRDPDSFKRKLTLS